jgi:ABC-2 type transport system permease protein/ribosome-dependent ATPase
MNLRRISTLVHKELREVLRDRLYLMLAFLLPVTLMFVFAYGMTSDVKDVGLVVVDEDQSLASRDYARRFLSTRHFRLLENQHPATAADQALIGNRARVVLWIGPEFGARLAQGRPVDVSVQIDGAFTASARTIRGYVEAINAQANAAYRSRHAAATFGGRAPVLAWIAQPVQLRPRFLYNPELRSVPSAWCARRKPAPSSTSPAPPSRAWSSCSASCCRWWRSPCSTASCSG